MFPTSVCHSVSHETLRPTYPDHRQCRFRRCQLLVIARRRIEERPRAAAGVPHHHPYFTAATEGSKASKGDNQAEDDSDRVTEGRF